MVTLPSSAKLCRISTLREVTGKQRDRVKAYQDYLDLLL